MEPATEPDWVNDSETSDDFYCENVTDCTDTCVDDCEEDHTCGFTGKVDKIQSGASHGHWTEYWTCPQCQAEYSEDCSRDDYYDA
jgi:hypothetical protein